MLISLASEINALATSWTASPSATARYRDFTLNSLTYALREVIACLPVYRTYTTDAAETRHARTTRSTSRRRSRRRSGATRARRASSSTSSRDTLLLRNIESFRPEDQPQLLAFVMKFQQITGPVMAKGVEDTAFYVYNRLVSLNEVGGDPDHFGVSRARRSTQRERARARDWPHTLLATSTHDTKRSEDVRARIDVLSEMPEEWRGALNRWARHERARSKTEIDERPVSRPQRRVPPLPDAARRLAAGRSRRRNRSASSASGSRPTCSRRRTRRRSTPAGSTRTRRTTTRSRRSSRRVLAEGEHNAFLADFAPFQRRVAFFGQFNALAQTLLKLTSPGVPDIYQGTELWDFSLVDPDNRRPVDYDAPPRHPRRPPRARRLRRTAAASRSPVNCWRRATTAGSNSSSPPARSISAARTTHSSRTATTPRWKRTARRRPTSAPIARTIGDEAALVVVAPPRRRPDGRRGAAPARRGRLGRHLARPPAGVRWPPLPQPLHRRGTDRHRARRRRRPPPRRPLRPLPRRPPRADRGKPDANRRDAEAQRTQRGERKDLIAFSSPLCSLCSLRPLRSGFRLPLPGGVFLLRW